MDISAGILIFQLQQMYDLKTNISMKRDITIKGFRIYGDEKAPEEGVLYVCTKEPPENIQWRKKLHIGINYKEIIPNSHSFYISVNGSVELYQLVNSLQDIFQKFYTWRTTMDRLCYQHEEFPVILNELEQTYGLISILVDKNLKYIAMSDSYSLHNSWLGNTGTMSLDLVNDLMTDTNFRNAIQHNKAFLYYYYNDNLTSYCYNIKINGEYEARILIQNRQMIPFYGGLRFAEYMGIYMNELFSFNYEEKTNGMILYEFYNIMKDLLHGIPKSTDEIQQQLNAREWKRSHLYQVYLFQFIEPENATVTRRYYQTEIESMFSNCCVFAEGERLCCIRNLTMTNANARDIRQKLSVFLRETLCKAGISQQFDDISQLHYYYLEAENALQLGVQSKSTWWYYPFENMMLSYIWHQAVQEMDAHHLYHPAIRTLIAYDEKQHSNMVRTVYEYMKHRYNITETAQALFIHRTSMLFRLQRIELLTGINWDSWSDRIHVAATFELMKQLGEFTE